MHAVLPVVLVLVLAVLAVLLGQWNDRARGGGGTIPPVTIGLSLSFVQGGLPVNTDRGSTTLLDTQKEVLSIAAKDQGGVAGAVDASEFSWASSDTSVATLEDHDTDADGNSVEISAYSRVARTPGIGSAVITVTHTPSGNTETLTLIVQKSGPGEIGLSAGSPVDE